MTLLRVASCELRINDGHPQITRIARRNIRNGCHASANDNDTETWLPQLSGFLERLAFVMLLAVITARPFLAEIPFGAGGSVVTAAAAAAEGGGGSAAGQAGERAIVDKSELARVTFAVAILIIAAIYLTSTAVSGRLTVHQPIIGAMIAAFIALGLVSALCASNKRAGLDSWIEQTSLLLAGFLSIQLFRTRTRFVLLICVLTAVAATLATKGFYQYFVENPDFVRAFVSEQNQQLRAAGYDPASPQARAFVNRLLDRAVFGYFGLANIFASLMIVLSMAGLGLAIAKLKRAIGLRPQWKQQAGRGQIHLPTLAAVAAAILAALPLVVLPLTRSRAGIAMAGLTLAAAAILLLWGHAFARRWKASAMIIALTIILGLAGVVAYGLAKDRLPGTSLTFRWHYWTASAEIARQHPLLGVGPGNFPSAYLAVRRPAAEEAVKTPHNFIAQAIAEYGLPGGLLFVAVVVVGLWKLAQPRMQRPEQAFSQTATAQNIGDSLSSQSQSPRENLQHWVLAAVVILTATSMIVFGTGTTSLAVIFIDVLLPAAVLAAMLWATLWFAEPLAQYQAAWRQTAAVRQNSQKAAMPPAATRGAAPAGSAPAGAVSAMDICLGCGLVGFVLHNLVEFSLFTPATAMVFWVALGAAIAQKGEQAAWNPPQIVRWVRPAFAWAAAIAAAVWLWQPVATRTALLEQLANVPWPLSSAAHAAEAAQLAERAARADPLDAASAGEAVRFATGPSQAKAWAREVVRRDEASSSAWSLAARADLFARLPDVHLFSWTGLGYAQQDIEKLRQAVRDGSAGPALLSRLAGMEYAQGHFEQAALLCQQALRRAADSPMLHVHLGNCLWRMGKTQQACQEWRKAAGTSTDEHPYIETMAQAVRRNPSDGRMRVDFAEMLLWANRPAEAMEQLEKANWLEQQLLPESIQRFTQAERENVDVLTARASCLSNVSPQARKPLPPATER